ncbi:MAG: hypothetical protein PUC42_12960 [Bacteroidales bacterium]|nr:hypothetical protein [Bacteroidales bacterium]
MEKCISQSQYLFYSDANVPYRGFVEGIGYVDSMYKDYVIAPSYSDIMTPGSPMYGQRDTFIQSIGYIPSVDSSPSMVMKSYGKDAAKKIEEHLVKYNGGNVSVNLGDKILNLSPKNKYRISSDIKNEYRYDAAYSIDIYYEDEKGSYKLNNTYLLNDIPGFFPFTDWQDLYTCLPESYSMSQAVDTAINLNQNLYSGYQDSQPKINIPNFSAEIPGPQPENTGIQGFLDKTATKGGYIAGVGGVVGSGGEKHIRKAFKNDVRNFIKSDIENLRSEVRPNVNEIEKGLREQAKSAIRQDPTYVNKRGYIRRKMRNAYSKAVAEAYKGLRKQAVGIADHWTRSELKRRIPNIVDRLTNGIDPRVASKFKCLRVLRVVNPVLNVIGGISSIWSFGSQIYDLETGKIDANWRTIGKTIKLGVDVVASGIAFVPGWGWVVAGIWFGLSTAVDLIWDYVESE